MKTFTYFLFVVGLTASLIAQTDDPHKTGNVPITFYGKVVDQHNQAVPGVNVEVWILQGYEQSPGDYKQRVETNSFTTDANGNFVVQNVKGSTVQLNAITKDGYKLSPKQEKRGYRYWPPDFQPDVNNPVVFKMWKKRGAEPLSGVAWHGQVVCDGTPKTFDLHTGKPARDGVLQIACVRAPLSSPPPGNARFDYKFQIKLIGGGIQPTEDEFTYSAPESGYSPSFTVEQKADDPKWWGRVTKEFYIKTPEGHYGRLSVDWYATQNSPNHLEWDFTRNPSGSRNLER